MDLKNKNGDFIEDDLYDFDYILVLYGDHIPKYNRICSKR
jgi:hypothetical protein